MAIIAAFGISENAGQTSSYELPNSRPEYLLAVIQDSLDLGINEPTMSGLEIDEVYIWRYVNLRRQR